MYFESLLSSLTIFYSDNHGPGPSKATENLKKIGCHMKTQIQTSDFSIGKSISFPSDFNLILH